MKNSVSANIAQLLANEWQGSSEDKDIFFNGDQTLSRSDFLGHVVAQQHVISSLIQTGDAVLIQAERGVSFFVDMVAVWSVGGVVVPVVGDATSEYLDHLISISEATLMLGRETVDSVKTINYSFDGERYYGSLSCEPRKPDDLAALLFTSGSTGVPKGVMLSHSVLYKNCMSMLGELGMKKERLFINIPFNFTSAICHFLACAFSDSTFVATENKMFPAELVKAIEGMNCTCFGGAPIQLRWIAEFAKSKSERGESHELNLKRVILSGDYLPVSVILSMQEHMPHTNVFAVYGLTELGGRFCVLDCHKHPSKIGSVGKPIEGLSVQIFDTDSDTELPAESVGEVVASGELVCLGYFKNCQKTERLLTPVGLRTGDIGRLDEEGFLYLSGRTDDVFKVNGRKVSGVVIAEALMKTDMFQDVAVLSENIDFFGVVPVAIYVMKDENIFMKSEVLGLLRELLPANHIPHRFVSALSIPRTGSGKVDRSKLRVFLESNVVN